MNITILKANLFLCLLLMASCARMEGQKIVAFNKTNEKNIHNGHNSPTAQSDHFIAESPSDNEKPWSDNLSQLNANSRIPDEASQWAEFERLKTSQQEEPTTDNLNAAKDESNPVRFGVNLTPSLSTSSSQNNNQAYLKDTNTNANNKAVIKTSPLPFGVKYTSAIIAQTLNEYGAKSVNASWSEKRPYFCSRFVRQVYQNSFKTHAEYLDDKLFGYSAYDTERMWKKAGYLYSLETIKKNGGLREGDLVFQNYPVWGHVGIVIKKDNKFFIAENTVRYGIGVKDYRAFTTLAKFGKIRSVGRLKSL